MHLSIVFPHHLTLSSSGSGSGSRGPGTPLVPRVVFKDGARVDWLACEGLFGEAVPHFCISHDCGPEKLL